MTELLTIIVLAVVIPMAFVIFLQPSANELYKQKKDGK